VVVDSFYVKSFVSDILTPSKYKEVLDQATILNIHKNKVSIEVANNLFFYMDMTKFNFLKYMRSLYTGIIGSNFDAQLYTDVYNAYQNKFDGINRSLTFEKIEYLGIELYKKDTKEGKKGDIKKVIKKKSKTELSITLTYLARYGNLDTIEYIQNQLKLETKKDKIMFYNNILNHIEKFTLDRLLKLAMSKKEQAYIKYSNPIEFKSLTFRGRSRKGEIIGFNKNFNSIINSFINLSWLERGSTMSIPVKYHKGYHGDMINYSKKSNDYEYVISFIDEEQIKITLSISGERYIPENKTNYVGIDVNIKHNMFALSTGDTFDYNRTLIDKLSKELIKIDNLKKDKEYKIGKKRENLINSLKLKLKKDIEYKCYLLCIYLKENGLDHIVMEDLQNGFGRTHVKNEIGINYNRLMSILNMSSIKDVIEHIAHKHDINVSTVHSAYTSKACSVCGCISDDNRQSQEHFKCVECGNELNADLNAALNIKNRVVKAVLCNNLLKQNTDNGTFKPKILERSKVKDVLLSFR